jgi:hypothetical protein
VYERDGSPLGDDEAADLLSRLVPTAAGAGATYSARDLKENRRQHRAVTTFTAANEGITFEWLAFGILWRARFLVCSCTAAPPLRCARKPSRCSPPYFRRRRACSVASKQSVGDQPTCAVSPQVD